MENYWDRSYPFPDHKASNKYQRIARMEREMKLEKKMMQKRKKKEEDDSMVKLSKNDFVEKWMREKGDQE